MADAVAIFNSLPPTTTIDWDSAFLVDGPDGTGALVVARAGQACGVTIFHGDHWIALLGLLEAPKT